KSTSQLLANVAAVGKAVEGILSFNPRWSELPNCFLIPLGPSARNIEGKPSSLKSQVSQVFFPDIKRALIFKGSCLIISGYFILFSPIVKLDYIKYTAVNLYNYTLAKEFRPLYHSFIVGVNYYIIGNLSYTKNPNLQITSKIWIHTNYS